MARSLGAARGLDHRVLPGSGNPWFRRIRSVAAPGTLAPIFFELSSAVLAVLCLGMVSVATAVGAWLGRSRRHELEELREPLGIVQAALLGVVGLILAFGLSLAVNRYEDRRASVVDEANAIGTTFLRAQTLPEPMRTRTLGTLRAYTRSAIRLADHVPGSTEARAAATTENRLQRALWRDAGLALEAAPTASAPRLYVETLNEMIDLETVRVASLSNRVPDTVFILEVIGSALALGLLASYLALLGRGMVPAMLASLLVALLLFVMADLDRPTRGTITVPDTPLTNQLRSMQLPPAAAAPRIP